MWCGDFSVSQQLTINGKFPAPHPQRSPPARTSHHYKPCTPTALTSQRHLTPPPRTKDWSLITHSLPSQAMQQLLSPLTPLTRGRHHQKQTQPAPSPQPSPSAPIFTNLLVPSDPRLQPLDDQRDHCTTLWAVQHPSITPPIRQDTSLHSSNPQYHQNRLSPPSWQIKLRPLGHLC